ncbi:MAG: hypothetical protein E6772_07550 [Dysgonomonas sp.]|nr:hypothetical protein [Dysgonomonas sp.]
MMKVISVILFLYFLVACPCMAQYDNYVEALAAKNIVGRMKLRTGNEVVVIHSVKKKRLLEPLSSILKEKGNAYRIFPLTSDSESIVSLTNLIKHSPERVRFIFLIDSVDSQFMFDNVGDPDKGYKIPAHRFSCDWLIPEDQFIRLHSIDLHENRMYQQKLLAKLNSPSVVHITTDAGTNIRFRARSWIVDSGKIFCIPHETETHGVIVVDGYARKGPPAQPVKLKVKYGRVTNTGELSEKDEHQQMLKKDFLTDNNASVMGEVGIGTNKNARTNTDVTESGQVRGTCYFGFGMNLNYGGKIESSKQFDLVILNPTITINDNVLYDKGKMIEL